MIPFPHLGQRVLLRELHLWRLDHFGSAVQTLRLPDVLRGVGLGERVRDGQGQSADSVAPHSVSPSERDSDRGRGTVQKREGGCDAAPVIVFLGRRD